MCHYRPVEIRLSYRTVSTAAAAAEMLLKNLFIPMLAALATLVIDVRPDTGIDTDSSEYLLQSHSLPEDLNFMPTLANGHLGYTVFGNAIFMNGIYNGHGGQSRRARLPNWLNLTAAIAGGPENINDNSDNNVTTTTTPLLYQMHLLDGYFRWLHKPLPNVTFEQRCYPHRYYNRALVYELFVQRAEAKEKLSIKLTQHAGPNSEAFDFQPVSAEMMNGGHFAGDARTLRHVHYRMLKGSTRLIEHERFQPVPRTVYAIFSDDLDSNGKTLVMAAGEKQLHYRFIITLDEDLQTAVTEMDEILSLKEELVLAKHSEEWRTFWQNFNIDINGNMELAQTIKAGIFYLANSLPSVNSFHPSLPYSGLSPTGLGRGDLDSDYEGHSFWDTEIWMLPVVTQMHTEWSKELLNYRLRHLEAARYNAEQTGYKGARFPWESAYTGTEVTNPCCPEVAKYQIHISADIAFALQHYYAATNDQQWLCETAWPIMLDIANYLESRVSFNTTTLVYHIEDVMGPDEDHWPITDNVYTNVVFKNALEFALFTQSQCVMSALDENWRDIADKLLILYDPIDDYHPQYDGYRKGGEIKQADAILMGYPLQLSMNVSTRLNDLNSYEGVTRASGPAMTWSMFTINFLDVQNQSKADHYFLKGYQNYVRPEFKVWSETQLGYKGSANFLTGIGGFLQALINGYGGIRIKRLGLTSLMEINERYLPPDTDEMIIKGIKFADAIFELNIKAEGQTNLTCLDFGGKAIELKKGREVMKIYKGFSVSLDSQRVELRTT